ncbi:uncharacterized protein HMPREF1541_08616 [Cyphellophora europaea CBS 101466]|uniref:Fungal N-terminal domain-containing protein n=1 Tax=Cyphellophora europaea (strain CBS 101466) TaxID=1220924 RepID=W2RKT1_CYPE1|nr:uncharacterized protein HMPREF1541_08616 [Cyphellophora europaea CBS 101466]ETN36339.1 hypothetical protein HMPREF1541_08616 [Cyphellophora europaea CBS 101466]
MEPGSIASAVFSGLNALVVVIKHSAHFAAVPEEVTQLQINVRLADDSVGTARRLRRLNASVLDDHLKSDVDRAVSAVEEILGLVRETVEACRKDLEIKKTVGWGNRAAWLVWRKEDFVGKLSTLTNALAVLNRDVGRMELCARLSAVTDSIVVPPGRRVQRTDEDENGDVKPVMFPRRPTMRRARSRRQADDGDSASIVSFNDCATLVTETSSSPASTQNAVEGIGTSGSLLVPVLYQAHSAPSQISLAPSSDMADIQAVDEAEAHNSTFSRLEARTGDGATTEAYVLHSNLGLNTPHSGNRPLSTSHSASPSTSRDPGPHSGSSRRPRSNLI